MPTLETDEGLVLTQSLAICEWLDETYPTPPLLPAGPTERAHVRAFALVVAADTHPVQNLRVLERLRQLGIPDTEVSGWARWIVGEGLRTCETLAAASPGPYCFGTSPTLADLCLVPQLFNARRFGCDLSGLPRLLAAEAACMALSAFCDAAPERQGDVE